MEIRPWYFEDWIIGEVYETPPRKVAEHDVANFGEVEGAKTATHLDPEAARGTVWGKMTLHGLLTLSIAFGLAIDARFSGTALALLSVSWTFHAPAFVGDELHVRWYVAEKRPTRNPARGILVRSLEVLNKDDVVIASGAVVNLWARRADAEK
jgi:acyl dehydratase